MAIAWTPGLRQLAYAADANQDGAASLAELRAFQRERTRASTQTKNRIKKLVSGAEDEGDNRLVYVDKSVLEVLRAATPPENVIILGSDTVNGNADGKVTCLEVRADRRAEGAFYPVASYDAVEAVFCGEPKPAPPPIANVRSMRRRIVDRPSPRTWTDARFIAAEARGCFALSFGLR